ARADAGRQVTKRSQTVPSRPVPDRPVENGGLARARDADDGRSAARPPRSDDRWATFNGEWTDFIAVWRSRFDRPPTKGQRDALYGEDEPVGLIKDAPD